MSKEKDGPPKDADPNDPAVQKLTALFQAEGVTAEELAKATFNRALEAAFLKKYGDEPTLPEAAAQRPDIDTITPTLT